MKYISLFIIVLLFISCKEEEIQVVNLRVNHFKQAAVGLGPTLVLLVQEGDKIGSVDWTNHYSGISGFDYEWGYVYDLKIKKIPVNNPPADGSSIEFVLEEVLSKTKVNEDENFEIQLKSTEKGIENLLISNNSSEYILFSELTIDCTNLCETLSAYLIDENEITGVFNHSDEGKIELQQLNTN